MKDPNQLVTRAILKEELKEAFTDVVRKGDLGNFATKEYLKTELSKFATKGDLSLEVDSKIAPLFYTMEKKMEKWKDEILTKEDRVITLLVKSEQEVAAMHFNYNGLKERVVNLEDAVFPETSIA